ncbi:MAG: hypothetical protein ACJZ8O_01205 [Pirellulaceae bacterium]
MNEHTIENPFAPPETHESARQVLVIHENVEPNDRAGLKRCAVALYLFVLQGWLLFGVFVFWVAHEHVFSDELGLTLMLFAGVALMLAYALGVIGTVILTSAPRNSCSRVAFVLAAVLMLVPIVNNTLIYFGFEYPELPQASFPPLNAMHGLDQLITGCALFFAGMANVLGIGRVTSFVSVVSKSPMTAFVFGIQCMILVFMAISFRIGTAGGDVSDILRHAVNVLAIIGVMAYFVIAFDCRRRILRGLHKKP